MSACGAGAWTPLAHARLWSADAATFPAGNDACVKGMAWSPDGLCLLTNSTDRAVRLFEPLGGVDGSGAVVTVRGSGFHSAAWYGGMDSRAPATCVFATAGVDVPVQLWDAYTGGLRATFSATHRGTGELAVAACVCFAPRAVAPQRLYAGYTRAVRLFDVHTLQCVATRPLQRGRVSCIAASAHHDAHYAIGMYDGRVGLFAEPHGTFAWVCARDEHAQGAGGVTGVCFSPCGRYLLVGGRRGDAALVVRDVRQNGRVVARAPRVCANNQRLQFDVDAAGTWLASGSQDASVRVWRMSALVNGTANDDDVAWRASLPAAGEVVAGVAWHPTQPRVLAVAQGGRRRWRGVERDSDSECDSDGERARGVSDNAVHTWRVELGSTEQSE